MKGFTTTLGQRGRPAAHFWMGALAILLSATSHADVFYVDDSATGANNGTSWTDAWISLQSALNSISVGADDTVRVAQGTYKPHASNTAISFQLKNVEILGGYNGGQSNPDDR